MITTRIALVAASLALFFQTANEKSRSLEAAEAAIKLAGATEVIEAAHFESLQAALDALPAEGGVVRLPPGRFEISEPLVLHRGDVLLQGSGAATQIVNVNREGRPALLIQHPDGEAVKRDERLWRIMLSNFRITGNPESGAGIVAVYIEEIFIQGVTVSHHGGDGIRLDRCYEDPRVSDCLITYNGGTGLNLLGCHDIVVAANQFEENDDALHCIDSFNLCMTGNCLDDHLGHGVVIENTYGSVVAGNMIEECNGTALIMDRDCYGNTVSANVIAHNGGGIDLRDAHGCSISANTFTIMKTAALRISPASGRITVTGNNFSNSYVGEQSVKRAENDLEAAGLVLDSATDVVIAGNAFTGLQTKAVTLAGDRSQRVVFDGNLLTEVESEDTNLEDSITGEVLR